MIVGGVPRAAEEPEAAGGGAAGGGAAAAAAAPSLRTSFASIAPASSFLPAAAAHHTRSR